jgi:hypothetical protein
VASGEICEKKARDVVTTSAGVAAADGLAPAATPTGKNKEMTAARPFPGRAGTLIRIDTTPKPADAATVGRIAPPLTTYSSTAGDRKKSVNFRHS